MKKINLVFISSIILFSLINVGLAHADYVWVQVLFSDNCPVEGAWVKIFYNGQLQVMCVGTNKTGHCDWSGMGLQEGWYRAYAYYPEWNTDFSNSMMWVDEYGNGNTTIQNQTYSCPSGYCVDGYCCDSVCEGNCNKCDVSGSEGNCTNVDAECTGDCDYCNNGNCAANETVCELMYCADCTGYGTSFSCTYDETEDEDCNPFDIATCFNIPDGYDFTWDYRDSYCTALNTCYEGTITHTCNQPTCSAECDEDIDCPETDCDYLDGCHSGQRYYDCNDVANDCLGTCTCESNSCPAYTTCSQTGTDNDFDGWDMECGDCNDDNPNVNPGATEIVDNGQDDNCDGYELCYLDGDDDGYRPDGSSTVTSVDLDCLDSGEAQSSDPTGDCNDADANVNPGAIEVCNGIDDNCVSGIDEEPAASASCDDSNECTDDQCVSSSCSNSNEPYGTYCGSARNCPDDACNGFFAEFYPIDGNDYCDGSGDCLVYSCDMEDSYCTDNNAGDGVNGLTCGAECDQNIDCSEECIDKKWYSTYSCNLGTCNCDLSDLICSEGHCGAECDYNDDCEGAKACLSDCTCSQIEGDLNGDCIVNILDLIRIGRAFDAHPSDDHWSPLADVVVDDVIDIFDLSAVGSHFGETC